MSLIAHCGTEKATRYDVQQVQEPPWTDTWHPVSHKSVIMALDNALSKTGLGLRSENYSMSQNGQDMFGVWTLDYGTMGRKWSIGIRNSLQKHFAMGIAAGFTVMVCDNMMISGDFITFRKHTAGLDYDELKQLANQSMGQVIGKMEGIETWHNNLHNHALPVDARKILTYDAMVNGVFAPSKLNHFIKAYDEEAAVVREDTAYTFHGAVTRLQRGNNLLTQAEKCSTLEVLVDRYCYNERLYRKFN